MSPLEDQYRRLLRLLPRAHRAARGDELLGLLLDLDDGRSRPSARQVFGLIALACRLRLAVLPAAGAMLFSAFLVAVGTMQVGQLIDGYTGAVMPADLAGLRHATPDLLAAGLPPFGVAVAWILGARRTALAIETAGLAYFAAQAMVGWLIFPLLMSAVLAVAAHRRWTTPRPRSLWLASVVLAVLAWKAIGVWGRHGVYYHVLPAYVGWIVAAATAVTAVIVTRRRHWLVIATAAALGAGAGMLLPAFALQLGYGRYGWLTSITVATAALGAIGRYAAVVATAYRPGRVS
jgi:hypothetical protein